jgi:nucleoid-associated protein YgaU
MTEEQNQSGGGDGGGGDNESKLTGDRFQVQQFEDSSTGEGLTADRFQVEQIEQDSEGEGLTTDRFTLPEIEDPLLPPVEIVERENTDSDLTSDRFLVQQIEAESEGSTLAANRFIAPTVTPPASKFQGAALKDVGEVIGTITQSISLPTLVPVPALLLLFVSLKVPIPIPIPLMFRPEKLEFSKEAHWEKPFDNSDNGIDCHSKKALPLHDVPKAEYKGGGPEELTLELYFDTTDTQLDVRLFTKPIQMLVYRVPLLQQPPLVMFSWGMMLSKMSYVKEVEIDYTMFRPDGTPLRAEVDLTLTEYDMGWMSMLPLNPTSVSEARKTWVVVEGQTLDWIAYQEYGDSAQWRHIAAVNNLDNPRDLRPGQILKLTPVA